jgi:cysteine synthase A
MADAVSHVQDLIGSTPLLKLPRLSGEGIPIFLKMEHLNPSGSIRDRYLSEIVVRAVDAGEMRAGDVLSVAGLDDCSVAASFLAPRFGLSIRLFAPESDSRRLLPLIETYGADIEWLPESHDWSDAIDRAAEWARRASNRMFVNGYRREAVRHSYDTVADEILEALDDRALGAFVTSVTTGGAYDEVSSELRQTHPDMHVGGAVLGARDFPDLDEGERSTLQQVSLEEAWEMRDRIAREDGILVGPKGAASVVLALKLRDSLETGDAIVALNPDAGQRYLGWEGRTVFQLDREPR